MDGPLKAAVLIVSTTAAKDPSTDSTSSILNDVFKSEGDGKWIVADTKIVTDHVLEIQSQIMAWSNGPDGMNLIVTTGGTGFAVLDSTPEVLALEYHSLTCLRLIMSGHIAITS